MDSTENPGPIPPHVLANLAYEFGTLRSLQRMHGQTLLVVDPRDTIAAHTSRVVFVTLLIAQNESLNIGKALSMAVVHDLAEARTGDHNWVAKKYIVIDEKRIIDDQSKGVPFLKEIMEEYNHVGAGGKRDVPEAQAVKDADQIDQLLLLREYEVAGNQEAEYWLSRYYSKEKLVPKLHHKTSRHIAEAIFETSPTQWWKSHWTNQNRSMEDLAAGEVRKDPHGTW